MRIISGTLKGRSINFVKNSSTRPLKDKVRESIFNILNHSNFINSRIENSNVLDLYSGTGSFGIECISRGAERATFIEQDTYATNVLKSNLIKLSIINKSKIYNGKIKDILNIDIKQKFNIFFLDPPFKNIDFLENLELIKKRKYFSENHIVIIHREKKFKDEFFNLLEIIETKIYGRSKIIFGVFN